MLTPEETVEYLCSKNKFFDQVPNARVTVNFDYEIDQLAKCLESEGVPVNKYEAMQLLDVYIRSLCGVINMAPLADNINVIKQLNIIIGSEDFPDVIDDKLDDNNDFIVIGCDGIWDCIQDQEICDIINKRLNEGEKYKVDLKNILSDICDKICPKNEMNVNSGLVGYDNMSCILIQLKN